MDNSCTCPRGFGQPRSIAAAHPAVWTTSRCSERLSRQPGRMSGDNRRSSGIQGQVLNALWMYPTRRAEGSVDAVVIDLTRRRFRSSQPEGPDWLACGKNEWTKR